MSDVGDAIEITFNAPTGADVRVDWISPTGTPLMADAVVAEQPPGSGRYPVVLLGQSPGVWTAKFTAAGPVAAVETYHQTFTDPTGPPPLATLDEYTDLFGPLSAPRQTLAKALLRRASHLVRDRYPGVDADIAAGRAPGNSVGLAVLNMVARVMRNPSGLRAETTGPFSRTYDPAASSGLLALNDTDLNLIDPTPTTGARAYRAATIRLNAGLGYHRRRW